MSEMRANRNELDSAPMTKTILTIVLAVVLIAGPTSAQTSPTGSAEERVAALEELTASQERLIGQQEALIDKQQVLIDKQEALLNDYRCMFEVDLEVVPGGCPVPELSEVEAADAALLCTGWQDEALSTRLVVNAWTAAALALEAGIVTMDSDELRRLAELVDGYEARVLAIIPNLKSELLVGLMGAMADSIKAVSDTYAQGGPAGEMAIVIRAAVAQLRELDAAIAGVCG